MAIYKVIHARDKYHDFNAFSDLIHYITDPSKALGGHIYGRGLFPEISVISMEGLCRAFHKTQGLLLRHSVLSFSPNERIDARDAANIAVLAIQYYQANYQTLAAVHEDKPHIHIHFLMNTLNYHTGSKYPGTREDYYGFYEYLKRILSFYGLKVSLEK